MSFKRLLCGLTASAMLMMCGCGDIYGSEAETDEETLSEEEAPAETDAPTEEESSTDAAPTTEATTATVPVTTTTVTEPETVEETTAAQPVQPADVSDENNIIPGVALWDSKDDVLARFGECDRTIEGYSNHSTAYYYNIDGSELFDIDMKGVMFFEFYNKTDELIGYGYGFGEVDNGKNYDYPYSHDELKAAYKKLTGRFIKWYGGEIGESDLYGIEAEYLKVLEDNSEMWAVYGVSMWGADSIINEVRCSHSIPSEEMKKIKLGE